MMSYVVVRLMHLLMVLMMGVDDVYGCRTGIASRTNLGELGQVIRVVRCSDECAGGVDAHVHVVVRVASVVDGGYSEMHMR